MRPSPPWRYELLTPIYSPAFARIRLQAAPEYGIFGTRPKCPIYALIPSRIRRLVHVSEPLGRARAAITSLGREVRNMFVARFVQYRGARSPIATISD